MPCDIIKVTLTVKIKGGHGNGQKKLEKLYERGRKLLREGKIEKAKEKFYQVIQYEDNVFVRNNLALTLYLSGDLTGALSVLEPALSGGKEDHRRVYELYRHWKDLHVSWESDYLAAVACFNMGNYEKAARRPYAKRKVLSPGHDEPCQFLQKENMKKLWSCLRC